ncbi:MAG: urea carboxylase [Actinomycetia bacterium]|nr:urea carboxylase [Actinomycetes bacterium]
MRVLIANRGEIACRIIRTLDRMGIESVAVYSEADRGAPHVGLATHSVALGDPAPSASYLSTERILDACARSGADALHPGYGFLAENAEFAAAVEAAGLAFVGPTPEQLRRFGSKDNARAIAATTGCALLPGTDALDDVRSAQELVDTVGFPLLVKSVAGGGGIGMLACTAADDLAAVVERAMRQAQQAFGDRRVFLERLVTRARHVEVQVFGDGAGLVAVLGERDCSTQRRRQKVVEEAPAPNLPSDVRTALHDAARRLLEPECYRSAGTVEFVFDASTDEFFFLEVNTRLQVEHAVTEAITGVDLVEWMVRLAAGDATPVRTYTHEPRGHAIEVRVYAEDPAHEFRPSAGVVTQARWPNTARVDTWVVSGTEVSTYYDPLLAKIVVDAPTRDEALTCLRGALDDTRVDGIETNLELLRSFAGSDVLAAGTVTTSSLEQHSWTAPTVDVLHPGTATTVQDYPGRLGYWHVGVPPSGPMDDLSFRIGNEILGNPTGAPGLECTADGPTLCFNVAAWICLAGARMRATLDGAPVAWWEPVEVKAGAVLTVGAVDGPGLRSYLLVRGGFDVPDYLGSASTFTLGNFGGHGGRALRAGDVLRIAAGTETAAPAAPAPALPVTPPAFVENWELAVLDGPHGAPEFFTDEGIEALYTTAWSVHYNSSRTGVRLVGPKPAWARTDGGEAGLHPSNIHDTPYVVGAVDFTGDMPILLGPDGPSLGGFVCPFTVVAGERWKLGQLAPGNTVRFTRVDPPAVTANLASKRAPLHPTVLDALPAHGDTPSVTYRRSGDRALLVEYGPMVLDLDLRLRAHALAAWLDDAHISGIVETTPGIRSLQVQVDGTSLSMERLLTIVRSAEQELPALDDFEVPSRIVHMPLSWDDPAIREAISRYMQSVRDDAPWCPWNIEFIRRINGLATVDDVRRIVFDAEYLVLGLGDVYLGAPVAVPVDPRHRLVTTKYNPARTWTPENAVGIGGAYLCVYGMEGPGGYQLVGRTVPVWHRYGAGPHANAREPWLLRFFDRIRWYPVAADELLELRADAHAGRLELEIEEGRFRRAEHRAFVDEHRDDIERFRSQRQTAFDLERADWERRGEFAAADNAALGALDTALDDLGSDPLPDGAVVVEAFMSACVWRIDTREGRAVAAGDHLVTIEAMKMETVVTAPVAGIVHRVVCKEGQMVSPGSPLVVLVADA